MSSEIEQTYLESLGENPWVTFANWYSLALKVNTPNPNSMTIATADKEGVPSCRTVLLKDWSSEIGFVFFTNYKSKKSSDLFENPKAELLFYWDSLFLQIRIRGKVNKLESKASKAYFQSRVREKQIAAWASKQSERIPPSVSLEERFLKYQRKFEGQDVPFPDFWGGWKVVPSQFEFWKGNDFRVHDRAIFSLVQDQWKIELIYP